MKVFASTFISLLLSVQLCAQSFPGNTWVGANLQYIQLIDSSTMNVDLSGELSLPGCKFLYINNDHEHSISFGRLLERSFQTDTGSRWGSYYEWQTVKILKLTKDTLVLAPFFTAHTILDSLNGRANRRSNPRPLLEDNEQPIVFIDSSKVYGEFKQFQQLHYQSGSTSVLLDSVGNYQRKGIRRQDITATTYEWKPYSFSGKLKRRQFNRLVQLFKESNLQKLPANQWEPQVSDGTLKAYCQLKVDDQTYSYASHIRALYWLKSKLEPYLWKITEE